MLSTLGVTSCLLGCAFFSRTSSGSLPIEQFAAEDTITRDVVILGGGSSGTYAGIRLKDLGKTIAIVERNHYLGGRGETIYTPNNSPINYGVEGFFNTSTTLDYLARLEVPYELLAHTPATDYFVNWKTGDQVEDPGKITNQTAAMLRWLKALDQFWYLDDGIYRFPDPVPEDLVRPISEFI